MTDTIEKIVEFPGSATLDEVRERVRAVVEGEGISQGTVAKECGVSSSALSQFLTGSYRGDNNKMAATLVKWLNRRAASEQIAAVMPTPPDWIEAPTARKIAAALAYAQAAGDIAVIYGGAGLSKTTTIRHYQRANANVWVVTATPATASVGVMLEETAMAMGLRDFPLHPARLQRAIVKRLDNSKGLLIYDEAQHLTKQALEAARSLHDATGVGLALAGNASVFNRLYGGGDNGFAQLFSRVGKRVALRRPVAGDVHAIAAGFGVTGKDERRVLEDIAAKPGALRMMVKTLRLAAMNADGPVTVTHIRAAWRDLQGDVELNGAA